MRRLSLWVQQRAIIGVLIFICLHLTTFSGCSEPPESAGNRKSVEGLSNTGNSRPFSYPKSTWEETVLAETGPGALWKIKYSRDRSAVAMLYANPSGARLMIASGEKGVVCSEIFAGVIGFQTNINPSSWHKVAYVDKNNHRVIVGPTPGQRWLDWEGLIVTPDAEGWTYSVRDDSEWSLVVNDKVVRKYSQIPRPSISDNGTAFAVTYQTENSAGVAVEFNGTTIGRFEAAGNVTINSDGKHYAFCAGERADALSLYVDGKTEAMVYEQIRNIVFSPDGRRIAVSGTIGGNRIGHEFGVPTLVDDIASQPVFSNDGLHLAWAVGRPEKGQAIIVNGVIGKSYARISAPVLSHDGSTLTYIADIGGKMHLILNDTSDGPFMNVGLMKLADRGGSAAFFVSRAKDSWQVRLDGQDGPLFSEASMCLQFGPDGRRIAYFGIEAGKVQLVVGNAVKATNYDYACCSTRAFPTSGFLLGIGWRQNEIVRFQYAP